MTMTIKDVHEAFLKKYPERKIGLTWFFKLKTTTVKKVSETNRRYCLCTICCNAAIVIEAANNFLNGKEVGVKQLTEREQLGCFANMTLILKQSASTVIVKHVELS